MPTKPLDRLMYAQGGLCFFCSADLPKAEASVEHLVASARGGSNGDDNCVACCKAINALFGSMSLKEKIKVVLNQKGQFKCPNGAGNAPTGPKGPIAKPTAGHSKDNRVPMEAIAAVVENLKSRGKARPRRMSTLASTIKALASLKLTDGQVDSVIKHLQSSGQVSVKADQVTYKL